MELVSTFNLKKYFPTQRGLPRWLARKKMDYVPAVDGVSLNIERGRIVGLVGESGSGKTTFGRLLLRLIQPTEGRVLFDGKNVFMLKGKELKTFRRKAQIVFQNPYSSLNPRMTTFQLLKEPLIIHGIHKSKEETNTLIENILNTVGLKPKDYLNKYPFQLSGGERQRIAICRTLILSPNFLVLDEPVSMLDASIRAEILNLLLRLKNEFDLTYLFITHDLAVARYVCDSIVIMHSGRIVEKGCCEETIQNPLHPYTKILISAVPTPNPRHKISLTQVGVRPATALKGCRFYPNCPIASVKCQASNPPLEEISSGRFVACWNI